MGPPPQPPPEVLSKILAFLSSDTLTLSNCSVVSGVWLDETRRYLFRITTINLAERTLTSFKHLLDSSPLLASVIHDLRVRGSEGFEEIGGFILPTATTFPLEDLAAVVSKLPALQDIRLLRSTWQLSSTDPCIPEVHVPSVKTLVLTDCRMQDPATSHDIYGWFPNLQSLFFLGRGVRKVSSGSLPPISTTLRLRALRFRTRLNQQYLDFLEALRRTASVGSLETFDVAISVCSQEATPTIGRFLSNVAPSLKHLTLRFTSERRREQRGVTEVWHPLHLDVLQSLETLTLVALLLYNEATTGGNHLLVPWPHMIHILSLIASPYLTTIKLTLALPRATPITPFNDPATLAHFLVLQDAILRLRTVKRLRIVAVDLGTLAVDRGTLHPPAGECVLPVEMQERFVHEFPVLHERGVLSFSLENTT